MDDLRYDDFDEHYSPGEWLALWRGQVVAHGEDYLEVVLEACRHAPDAVLAKLPHRLVWNAARLPWD